MPRSIDSINISRGRGPITSGPVTAAPTAHARSSSATSGLLIAVLLLGGAFFLATRPTADAGSTDAPAAASSSDQSVGTPTNTQPGPPQPDQSQSLEQAVILDHPLDTSQAQDGSTGKLSQPPASAAAPTSVKPDSFTVRILNGSGQSGLATTQQSTLTAKGFRVTNAGTATNQYSTTVIYYTAGHTAQAQLIQAAVGRSTIKLQQDPIAQPADVLLVLGADAIP